MDDIMDDISPNINQAATTAHNRTSACPFSPDHPMTSCGVSGAPNDLEQRRRVVAVPEKPPAASIQPVTNENCRANNRSVAFRRVFGTKEYTAPHN